MDVLAMDDLPTACTPDLLTMVIFKVDVFVILYKPKNTK